MQETPTVLKRLDQLERSNRRWKGAGALLALCAIALAATGNHFSAGATKTAMVNSTGDGVLRGERLELRDPAGEVYAEIRLDAGGAPLLTLSHGDGLAAITLDQPALYIRSSDGSAGAFVGFESRGAGKMELASLEKRNAVRLAIGKGGTTGVYVLDDEGYDRITMESLRDGHVGLTLRETQNRVRASMGIDPTGNSSMLLLDPSGRRRAGMLVVADGTPLISMEDENSVPRINLKMEYDGSSQLEFLRADGRTSHTIP